MLELVATVWTLAIAHPPGPPPAEAECKSAFGKTACGFSCVAAYGDVKCAETPEGRCQAAYGEVVCWDPEHDGPPFHKPHQPRPLDARATCQSAYGKTACGHDCKAAYGEIKCARTPLGVCEAAYGKVVCWDPPRWVRGHQRARCETAYGQIACGYRCVAAYGKIRCASSPEGACQAAYGDVVCSD